MDPWIRITAIVIGLASCFYGYPLFRFLLVLAGLIYGYIFGQSFYPSSHPGMSVLFGVIAAVGLAVLAYPLWSLGVVAVGAALGYMILSSVGIVLNLPQAGVILLGFLGAVILGFLFYRARDLFVMLLTAYNGAVEMVFGLGLLHSALAIRVGQANFLAVLAIVVLGSLGFATQYAMFKDQRKYSSN